ncbi:MAG: MarR family winged helix-turn-helix transcriptional regulator [Oscillospiraceae bacterium]|nr:MarR family winged helix-turn-helix transcriptional regulator [Oscillospiraceae bacterium]
MELEHCNGRVWDFVRVIKTEMDKAATPILQSVGLSELQAITVMAVESGDFHTIGRLSEKLNTNQGNFSASCKRLEQMGLITRKRSSDDERVVMLELTELGKEKANTIHSKLCEMFKKARLTQPQLETIMAGYNEAVNLFKKINDNQ